ncbi:sugar-phosphatase [Pantoea sp. 1.19]|uniref:sugar-phosphatase n=1 Tax=Pantoea sp. 1.19 TaxID=1925589 RepID=UPI000948DCEF|nr:sugar-phosphatase [Pantoea sp. 1.19]
MAIQLIAIDMDGTLLNPQHEITPRVKQAIQAARARGVTVVLATGRPFVGVKNYLAELGLNEPGQYCVTNNGALVQRADTGECVAEVTLSLDEYVRFYRLAESLGVHFHAMDKDHLYTPNKDISEYTVHESSLTGIPLRYRTLAEMDPAMRFPKVMMIDEPAKLDAAIARIPAELKREYTIMKSAPYYLEILDKRVNKGTAVSLLAERLGLARDRVMTLGDQENDLAMIAFAGIGVAMGNAVDSVKAITPYHTASNREDGAALAIEKYVLDV